jgi:tetratricopeptide (TPR) repeat protein
MALEAEPGHGAARTNYGVLLLAMGSLDEAAVHIDKAAALDPLYGISHRNLAYLALTRRDYDSAVAGFRRGAELGDYAALVELPIALHLAGRDRESLEKWIELSARRFPSGDLEPKLRQAFDRSGIQGATASYLEALVAHFGTPCLATAAYAAKVLALSGERERMFVCLDESIRQRKPEGFVKVHPIYDPYRDDPRFQAYLRRIGLDIQGARE